MPTAIPSVLADLDRVFRAEGLRWYVFGAQAVIALGLPRATADVDVTVAAARRQVPGLVAALHQDFEFRDVGNLETFISQSRVIPLLHRASATPVDIVLAGPGVEDDMLARAQLRPVGRARIPFIEANDLLVVKILAGRPKDLEDVRGLLRGAPPDVDRKKARQRIVEMGALLDDSSLVQTWDDLVRETLPRSKPPPRRGQRKKTWR